MKTLAYDYIYWMYVFISGNLILYFHKNISEISGPSLLQTGNENDTKNVII